VNPSWWERLVFGPDPRTWSLLAHRLTQWRYFTLPDAEFVVVPKARQRVRSSVPMIWPASMVTQATQLSDRGRVPTSGSPTGTPMQAGTTENRSLTWGYAQWGQQERATIPRPALGWFWTTGYPCPAWDRHCVIAAPDGSVHELIMFDPTALPSHPPSPNQALGWGRWVDGELVDGRATTATNLPQHRFIWTPWSHHSPHEMAVVLGDYVGADGLLTDGPVAGSRLVLGRETDSYIRMRSLGGECSAMAEALAEFGCRIIDRSGYVDAPLRGLGTKPRPPSLLVQPARQWAATNQRDFTVQLRDLRQVIE
jgi:hypothetical protein